MNEYIIDKLESLGIRNLAKRVIENEDKILDLEEEIERLNNVIRYIENYFSKREYYEFAQLVRDVKESNIEWLENSLEEKN